MVEPSRYDVSEKDAGISCGVLKNKLSITDQKKLDDTETLLLADSYKHFFDLLAQGKTKFDLSLLFQVHKFFLEPLYSWAGKIRTVDISKDGMLFAPAKYIENSLKEFKKILQNNIPKQKDSKSTVAAKIALIHSELNAIHPFREGNGRTVRLFLDLLAVNAGYNPIDWSKKSHNDYIKACIAGMNQEYKDMEKIIYTGLTKKN